MSKGHFCNGDGPFFYDFDEEAWIYFDLKGHWYKTQNQPPCEGWKVPKERFPGKSSGTERQSLGVTLDENGEVNPIVHYADYAQTNPGNISLDDRLTLVVAVEYDWELPFETDMSLLDIIGIENISFSKIDIKPDGKLEPFMVTIQDIRLRDAIQILSNMGFTDLEGTYDGQSYRVELNGPIDNYDAALIYRGGTLTDTLVFQ